MKLGWVLLWLCFGVLDAGAQDISVTDAIRMIERESDFIINFDRGQTDSVFTSFVFDGDFSREQVEQFFEGTTFDIEWDGKLIVLLPLTGRWSLCGTLVSEDGWPLPYAHIRVGPKYQSESLEDGGFSLDFIGDKRTECVIRYLGYQEVRLPISELLTCDTIRLQQMEMLLAESVIIRSYLKKKISEGRSFGGLDLDLSHSRNDVSSKNQDVFQTIQDIPGITSPNDAMTNLNIRGGSADHNNITWEDVPIYDRGYLSGMISSINPFHIDKVNVFRSNTSAEKNSRIGGRVEMLLGEDMLHSRSLSAGVNTTEGHLNIGLPLIKDVLGVYLAGRKSLFSEFEGSTTLTSYGQKIFQTQVLEDDSEDEMEDESSEESEPKIDYHDFNAKVIYKPDDKWLIKSSMMVADGRNENLSTIVGINLSGKDISSSSSDAYSTTIRHEVDKKNTVEVKFTHSNFKQEDEIEYQNDSLSTLISKEELKNTVYDSQVKLKWHGIRGDLGQTVGYIYDRKGTRTKTETESVNGTEMEDEVEVDAGFHHLFIDHRWTGSKQLFEYGLRTTYAQDLGRFFFSPSVSYRYRLNDHLFLRSGAGIYHQFIRQIYNTVDDGLNDDKTVWALNSSSDEEVMRSLKWVAGGSWKSSSWLFDVEAYLHHTSGLAAENPILRNTITLDRQNKLLTRGIDFLIQKKSGAWSTSVFYSLSRNTVRLPAIYEDENESFPANNDQAHKLTLSLAYELSHWQMDVRYHFKSGLPYSNEARVEQSHDVEEAYELRFESINNALLDTYHRVDFKLGYEGRWRSLRYNLGGSVLNVLNHENIGSRKQILATSGAGGGAPAVTEVRKKLLPRTFILYTRIFF